MIHPLNARLYGNKNYMIKKIYLFALFTLLLYACSPERVTIPFGYYECLKMGKNEKQLQITKAELEFFKKQLLVDSSSLILNRVIASDKRYTYISMSKADSPEMMAQQMKKNAALQIYNSKQFTEAGKDFMAYFFKKENFYVSRVLYFEQQVKNMIMFDYLSNDSSSIAIFYKNHNLFADKINCVNDVPE